MLSDLINHVAVTIDTQTAVEVTAEGKVAEKVETKAEAKKENEVGLETGVLLEEPLQSQYTTHNYWRQNDILDVDNMAEDYC